MFELLEREAGSAGVPADAVWPADAWLDDPHVPPPPPPPDLVSPCRSASAPQSRPSGWLALRLDEHTADPSVLSDAALIDGIVGFERVTAWAQARQARLLAEFARRRPGDDAAAGRSDTASRYGEFAADEVSLALRLSRTTANARLATACTVVDELPGTWTLWEQGRLDVLKVRAVTETACTVPTDRYPALEARVLPRAPEQTVAQLRAALSRAVLAIDPHGARRRHHQQRAERRVVMAAEGDGMASLWALLPAPAATAAYARLSDLARGLGAADTRGMDARRADLLADLLTGTRCAATATPTSATSPPRTNAYTGVGVRAEATAGTEATLQTAAGGRAPAAAGAAETQAAAMAGATSRPGARTEAVAGTGDIAGATSRPGAVTRAQSPTGAVPTTGHGCRPTGPGKPLVHVVVPVTMLLGLDDHPGELVGHGPIPADLARQIAADGTWRRLLTDPASGALLDHGRRSYTPPAGLADFVRARDVVCRFPTCRQPAARADLDHTVPYPDGTTSAANLHAACRHHHRGKTHHRWRTDQHPDGPITYTAPTGHTYTSEPHDYRTNP